MAKKAAVSDRIIDGLDNIGASLTRMLFGEDPVRLIDLLSNDGDGRFICEGGIFVSLIKVEGFNSVVGRNEFTQIIENIESAWRVRLSSGGCHTIKMVFEGDPDATEKHLELSARKHRAQAKRMGLNIDDLIDEKIKVNAKLCQIESCYVVLYTLPSILSSFEKERKEKEYSDAVASMPSAGDSQSMIDSSSAYRNAHESTVTSLEDVMRSGNLIVSRMNVLSVLRNIKRCTHGELISENWFPDTTFHEASREEANIFASTRRSVQLDDAEERKYSRTLRPVNIDNNQSLEPIAPRSYGQQLAPNHIYPVNGRYLVVENQVHAPFHVVVQADVPRDFDQLIRTLANVPFRLAFTLTPDGLTQDFFRSTLAGMAQWMSTNNSQITETRKQLSDYVTNNDGTVVGLSITGTTWAPAREVLNKGTGEVSIDLQQVASRYSTLEARFNDWGGVSISSNTGNPIETFYSTIPGLRGSHSAEVTPYPLRDAIALMPFTRVASAWDSGTLLYRTIDGKPIHYEQQSPRQNAAVTLIVGPMGFGKSSQMNALNLGFTIKPSESESLPYNRILDFGPSARGYIELIKSSLPEERKHEALYHKLVNRREDGVNVLGTPLGSRVPLSTHVDYLVNFLMTTADSISDYHSLEGLIKLCISQVYSRYTDEGGNASAKRYSVLANNEINDALTNHGIAVEDDVSTWWYVVDALFEAGDIRMATKAQRHAVPVLSDVATVATSELVRSEYGEDYNGTPVVELLARSIRETIDKFPFLSGITQLDFENSPVVALNLRDMASNRVTTGRGNSDTAVVFLVALRLLTEDFFVDADLLVEFDPRYREYHSERVRKLSSIHKGLSVDERHRVQGVEYAEAELKRLILEGRKYKIAQTQASPQWSNFDESVQDLATTIIFCGVDADSSASEVASFYGLSDTHAKILSSIRKPNKFGAEMLAVFKTDTHGKQVLRLKNTEGPLMLCAMASEADDRGVYGLLVEHLGDETAARQVYASSFPSGSVAGHLAQLQDRESRGLYEVKARDGSLLVDLANMAIAKYNRKK